jgi:hypothetical protein
MQGHEDDADGGHANHHRHSANRVQAKVAE